jgi:hypothetical protein
MKNIKLIAAILMLSMGCSPTPQIKRDFQPMVQSGTPLNQIGYDDEVRRAGNYETIWTYCLDDPGNVYISDEYRFKVDKFNQQGKYLFSFGGIGTEANKYPGWTKLITAIPDGKLIAYCSARRCFLVFPTNGDTFKTVPINPRLNDFKLARIKSYNNNRIFLLGESKEYGYQLLVYTLDSSDFHVIHSENRQNPRTYGNIPTDFDFDRLGNIYIIDSINYMVYKYNPEGKLLEKFFKPSNKDRINAEDFVTLKHSNQIKRPSNYQKILAELEKNPEYYPAIFGIDVDDDNIYLWTTNQDSEKRFIVDIYDSHFNYGKSATFYNVIGSNLAVIKEQKLYIPNVHPPNNNIKVQVGKLGVFNIPYKLEIYAISPKIYNFEDIHQEEQLK